MQNSSRKMTLKELISPEFQKIVLELLNNESLAVSASWNLLGLIEEIEGHQKHFESLRHKLLDRHAKKDAQGKLMLTEDKNEVLLEDKLAFDKAYQDLLDLEVFINPIPLSLLRDAKGISPIKLKYLAKTILNPSL